MSEVVHLSFKGGTATYSVEMPTTPIEMLAKASELEEFANYRTCGDPVLSLTLAAFMRQIASLIERVEALERKS